MFLVGLMLFGGCAGSTTGGIKVSRWIVFFRTVRRELNESFRPKVIRYVGLNGNNIDEEVQQQTMFFIAISAVLIGICALILSALEPGLDVFTCLSGSIAMLMNIGPALGDLGPTETYASLHPWTKVFLAILMAVGRLEIFAILVLFFLRSGEPTDAFTALPPTMLFGAEEKRQVTNFPGPKYPLDPGLLRSDAAVVSPPTAWSNQGFSQGRFRALR